ncbi:autophagy-related protein 13-domain-containing protein [Chytridium lagenaria]|nr:autophagy-related protein 13-domain-containing protein [Chytridium lagenaria]
MYKKMVMFFRSLYAFTRLLPAYRLFRKLRKSKSGPLKIGYRLSTGRFNQPDEAGLDQLHLTTDMRRWVSEYRFENVDTTLGTFNLHVTYRLECEFTVDNPEAVLSSRFADMDNNYFAPRSLDAREQPRPSSRNPLAGAHLHQNAASSLPIRQAYPISNPSSHGSATAVAVPSTSPNPRSTPGAVNIPSASLPVHLRTPNQNPRASNISTSPSPDVYRYRIGSATDAPVSSASSTSSVPRVALQQRRDERRVFLQSPGSGVVGSLVSSGGVSPGRLFDASEMPPFSALVEGRMRRGWGKKKFRLSSDALLGWILGVRRLIQGWRVSTYQLLISFSWLLC